MSGIYIHIPFCKQACSYCDFYFVTRDRLIPEFLDALHQEIDSVPVPDGSPFPSDPVRTVYIGGGTPSRLSEMQIQRLFEALQRRFDLSELTECTVEVNPEDASTDWLSNLKELGVTRLSMGIQSFQPDLLEFMHRAHTADQAHRALEQVRDAGFPTFSVDLIYGCPDQDLNQLREDMRLLMYYRPPHVSAYSLTIEPRTRLGRQAALGRLKPADDEKILVQARVVRQALARYGIHQYEISNYAAPGDEAVHNTAYWRHENYLGLGPAAHSFYWPRGGREGVRWYNPPDIHKYGRMVRSPHITTRFVGSNEWKEAAQPAESQETTGTAGTTGTTGTTGTAGMGGSAETADSLSNRQDTTGSDSAIAEILSLKTLAGERLLTGLRTAYGIHPDELQTRYGHPLSSNQRQQIDRFRHQGFLLPDNPLRLTENGMDLADALTLRLMD
ncbi:MAG: radical SAM family heme chaperone HemW [Cyclonatronaceae bacterium]